MISGQYMKYSLNNIDPDHKNIKRIFNEALKQIKDDIITKKIAVTNPKLATDNSLPLETIIFEEGMFKRILNLVGI